MRLVEAIVNANHAALEGRRGEAEVSCRLECLPLAALTCIDPRLNKLFPGALGLDEEQFIWLRNAGNVITSPTSSTVRSMALAVLLKGAKEIAVIGHTDCKMAKLGVADVLERLKAWGLERTALPIPNLQEFFGLFSSEKPNVMKAVGYLRQSPIIPPKLPVHGLIIDTDTGRLDWVVNGYETPRPVLETGVSLEKLVSEALPANVPGYVSGPLKSLAANLEPIVQKNWEIVTEKVAEKVEKVVKPPAPPPLKPPADKKTEPPPKLKPKRTDPWAK
jgi:carbonic anhydrase